MAKKADYGRGHPAFLEYVQFIVTHPSYAGMPDLRMDDGEVQWEAPSNRTGGKFKDSHHRRRDWWRKKAVALGIDPESPHWISKTAKRLHPTKKKPCKKCGKVMDIRYAYPTKGLLGRIEKLPYVDESFPLDPLEHILDLVPRMAEQFGDRIFANLPGLLRTAGVEIPALPSELDPWLSWIDTAYIPSEPRTLSPGVMSNAPDRLDGFHSFNLCCRSTADPGRSKENLQSYTTDRRVFEYWVDGDWVAADHLMGLIRANPAMKRETCRNGHPGPCSADHIGPISLGFAHRPEFQLLCKTCNSAKNNRMYLSDVQRLIEAERAGEQVASWYCQELWGLCKGLVNSEETALRLSKILRDNRHTVMYLLGHIAARGHLTFLCTSFLGLERADREPTFKNLRVENHITAFDALNLAPRATKYAVEQKARRLRVAFSALHEYVTKESRNAYLVTSDEIERRVASALVVLGKSPEPVKRLDAEIKKVLAEEVPSEEQLRALVIQLPTRATEPVSFAEARKELAAAMGLVARQLRAMWTNDRYVREAAEEEDPG